MGAVSKTKKTYPLASKDVVDQIDQKVAADTQDIRDSGVILYKITPEILSHTRYKMLRHSAVSIIRKSAYAGIVVILLGIATATIVVVGRNLATEGTAQTAVRTVARNDTATVVAGGNVALSVLNNDEGDDIYISAIERDPSVGRAQISSDRQRITYWAPDSAAGRVSLSYRITDNRGTSAAADVSIEVVRPSNPAVALPPKSSQESEDALRGEALARSNTGDFGGAARIYEKLGNLYGHGADFWGAADFLNAAIPGTPENNWDCHQAISLYRRAAALGEFKAEERLRTLKQWADRTKSDNGKKGETARACLRELS